MKLLPIENKDIPLVCQWLSRASGEWLEFGIAEFTPLAVKLLMNRKDEIFRLFTSDDEPALPIGIVVLSNVNRKYKSASMWAVLGQSEMSKRGYTCRALIEILKIAFFEQDIESINCWLVDGNRASLRLLEILGFHYVGRQRRCHLIQQQWRDRLHFDLLRSEFEENIPHLEARPVEPRGVVFPESRHIDGLTQGCPAWTSVPHAQIDYLGSSDADA
jgi:RimJ/RimL family protein N-acetyltransferase